MRIALSHPFLPRGLIRSQHLRELQMANLLQDFRAHVPQMLTLLVTLDAPDAAEDIVVFNHIFRWCRFVKTLPIVVRNVDRISQVSSN